MELEAQGVSQAKYILRVIERKNQETPSSHSIGVKLRNDKRKHL
jgi:hypothetical protein